MCVLYFAILTCTGIMVTDNNMAGQPGSALTAVHTTTNKRTKTMHANEITHSKKTLTHKKV